MVKLRKALQDGDSSSATRGTYHTVRSYTTFKGYRRRQLARAKVLKMLTPRRAGPVAPEEISNGGGDGKEASTGGGEPNPAYENGDGSKEFLSTGRTGRRNALPDILGRHAETGISDLPDRFEELTASGTGRPNEVPLDPNEPGTSKQHG